MVVIVFVVGGAVALYVPVDETRYDPYVKDPTYEMPYSPHDTVPDAVLFVLVLVVPFAVFMFVQIFYKFRFMHDVHNAMLGLLWTLSVSLLAVACLKVGVGYRRPDFLGRVASGSRKDIQEGMKAFPSGHAAASFAAFLFVSLYICGKTKICCRPDVTPRLPTIAVSVLIFAPLALALYISATRITDFRHSPSDVAFGAFLGIVSTMFAYHLVYPPVTATRCERPIDRVHPIVKPAPVPPSDAGESQTSGSPNGSSDACPEVVPPVNDV
jgi:diacylglycerol diphosphate phosphatase/phosphatidate phosphatase